MTLLKAFLSLIDPTMLLKNPYNITPNESKERTRRKLRDGLISTNPKMVWKSYNREKGKKLAKTLGQGARIMRSLDPYL